MIIQHSIDATWSTDYLSIELAGEKTFQGVKLGY